MSDPASQVQRFVQELRRRWRLRLGLRTAGTAAAVVALPVLAFVLVSRLVHPGDGVLIGTALAAAGLALAMALLAVVRRPGVPDDRQLARFVEEWSASAPGVEPFDDALATAVDVERAGAERDGFRELVLEAAARRLDSVAPTDLVPPSAVRRSGIECLAGVALLAAALAIAAGPLLDAVLAARLRWDPHALTLSVAPGNVRVVVGQPVTIRATLRAGRRAIDRLSPTVRVTAGGQERTIPMRPAGDGFELAIASVDRSFDYAVTAAAAASDRYTVTALVPPHVTRIDAHYEYPAFTTLPPRDQADAGDLFAPKGTRVRLTIHADKPLAGGALVLGQGAAAPLLSVTGDRQLQTELELTANTSYRLRLSDRDGVQADDDTEYFIRLVDDRPPDVRITRPGGDQQITPLEEVAIEARADDDYGIGSLELVYGVAGKPERTVPFARVEGTAVARIGSRLLQAEALGVQPGDVISYYARARDVARGKPATTSTSDMFFLEVKPFNEEFVVAQSQAMAGQGDPQLDSLIDAQKQIIAGTWNLERRAAAGRSAADVKALADAQRELKGRVERTLRQPSARPFELPPQQIAFQPRRRPVGTAAVAQAAMAMGEAAEQLDGSRTRAAIPHEMTALQGLLQAQAEIRRRQILQQASGASGGGFGRQGQDLSALFDKELQRQQRTNYETRAQIEERPAQASAESALDRIRDLARRQEELARRQQAAQTLQAEALTRELEKLEREQARLREQAEQLQRQMASSSSGRQTGQRSPQSAGQSSSSSGQGRSGQPAGSGQGQGQSPGQGEAQAQVARALDQMRRAADSLRGQSAGAAAASGSRAAEQLRQAEQQLSGASDDARQRSVGDLGLEAHQLAEAQRRVADETERLDREGPGRADALRRLAGQKSELADRVDAMQRSAEGLASSARGAAGRGDAAGGSDPAQAAQAAARALDDQRVAHQMRESADRMRAAAGAAGTGEPGPPPGQPDLAAVERQIARTLDEIAGGLGGRGGADARRLSTQLDESRALRDRLDSLQRQIREAEAAQQSRGSADGRSGSGRAAGPTAGSGAGPSSGEAGGQAGLDRLRAEYGRELQRARDLLSRNGQGGRQSGGAGATPEEHAWSTSAPGTEAFKQDFSGWDQLRKDIDAALGQYEDRLSQRLSKTVEGERLRTGGSDRAPDAYDAAIARYYESLARAKQ